MLLIATVLTVALGVGWINNRVGDGNESDTSPAVDVTADETLITNARETLPSVAIPVDHKPASCLITSAGCRCIDATGRTVPSEPETCRSIAMGE